MVIVALLATFWDKKCFKCLAEQPSAAISSMEHQQNALFSWPATNTGVALGYGSFCLLLLSWAWEGRAHTGTGASSEPKAQPAVPSCAPSLTTKRPDLIKASMEVALHNAYPEREPKSCLVEINVTPSLWKTIVFHVKCNNWNFISASLVVPGTEWKPTLYLLR